MCGRATYKLTWGEIVALYRLTLGQPAVNTRARFNVCPTTTVVTILGPDDKRELVRMRWGLIPAWWSKPLKEMKLATFKARAETVATKPMFRSAFKRNRCFIPVSGYYEWQDTPGGKQPWYFTALDGSPALTISGLWDEWQDNESGKPLRSCTNRRPSPWPAGSLRAISTLNASFLSAASGSSVLRMVWAISSREYPTGCTRSQEEVEVQLSDARLRCPR
jgi:hypothetical protein